jgi:quercetin dioxygenase-like cupin family protein
MSESERTRVREREPGAEKTYDKMLQFYRDRVARNAAGPVVVRKDDREVELSRQGRIRYYLNHQIHPDTPLQQWLVFTHELRTQSGKHRHQGGLVIYVIDGKGYSIVEGERLDWEKGDLLLLPMKPGGVEHQHFNLDPAKPSNWIAFINTPLMEHLAHEMTQMEDSAEFKEANR